MAATRGDARKTQLQWQMPTTLDDLHLCEPAERRNRPHPGEPGEVAEEFRRRVWKRIVAERADGDDRDFVERAKHRRFRQQHQVATGKIDGLVARLRSGYAPAGHAPVVVVKITRRQVENRQWPEANRSETPSQRPEFGALPPEALPDIHRMNAPVPLRQLGEHHTGIKTAADQRTDR